MRNSELAAGAWRRGATTALFALALGVAAGPSQAGVITFSTPGGSFQNGLPVDASATITTSAGTVSIVLRNLQTNPTAVIQNVSDLLVTFSNDVGASSLTSSDAQEVTIAGAGTYVLGGSVATGWALSSPLTDQLYLNVLGTLIGPAHTLIGPPGYAAANGSIAGNGPHNPFLFETATFNISAPGVTADTTVTAVDFSFGTTQGANITPGAPVPEPGTLLLIGSGLGGLVLRRRRRAS